MEKSKEVEDVNRMKERLDPTSIQEVVSAIPKARQTLLKWNGWGYKDSRFFVKERQVAFSGSRYPLGEITLPHFKDFIQSRFSVDIDDLREFQAKPMSYPTPIPCPEFREEMQKLSIEMSDIGDERLFRAHGQSLHDIWTLRCGQFERIPDLVIWPKSHDDVVEIIKYATKYNVVIIPFGGGTAVSGAVTCPTNEKRAIVSLDTSQMNRLLWLDRENLTACFESGIVGQDLERILKELGLTMGHEPDSCEFSTLGGWVATKSSGMKKNIYGNIEDIVVRVRMVTPKGVLEKNTTAPRISAGPDFDHIIIGSEGTLGVITEVVVKLRPKPQAHLYGSLVFPDFESGVRCLREVARRRLQPASIRLLDNEQFQFGQALKPPSSWFDGVMESVKKGYLTKIKNIDLNKMVVATLSYEGDTDEVNRHQKILNKIAEKFGGIPAGGTNGERGYILTFVIAYVRDAALEFGIVAESFETSVPWDRCEALCRNVKHRVKEECLAQNLQHHFVSVRVTQTYDSGACCYFYFAFNYNGVARPDDVFDQIERKARDEILASGGTISHHHGVGKLRKEWYPQSVSDVGVNLYKATKRELDPNNLFALCNIVDDADYEHELKAKL